MSDATVRIPRAGGAGGAGPAPAYELHEDEAVRAKYEQALARRRFSDPDRTHVVMGVYTSDLAEGRGDVYVAVGLGRQLEELGYEVVYLSKDDWYDPPEGTDIFVSMLAERTVMLDPWRLPPGVRRLAWCRNNTERWAASEHLGLYDGLLCSSEISQAALRRVYPGPIGVLRIGVDDELFTLHGAAARDGAARGRDGGLGGRDGAGQTDGTAESRAPADRREGVVATVNLWGGVRGVFAALRDGEVDYPLALYGTFRGLPPSLEPYAREPLSYFAIPSLYRQVEVVLDDQQDVNRGFGNVNSRIYESLACGAMPVTNTRLGLRDVGLERVPAYGTPDELRDFVEALRGYADRRASLVEDLREVVLARHSYRSRAADFDAFVREHGLDERHATHPVVAFFPDYTVTNPYQSMLYARLPDAGAAAAPVPGLDRLGEVTSVLGDRLVLHLHWTAPILGPAQHDRDDAQARLDAFLRQLDAAGRAGARLVWTVHNVLPHECRFPDLEAQLRQTIADRADAVHVMCGDTPGLLAEHYRLPEKRTRVIGHASYVDVYPNLVSRTQARDELGLPADATVFLAFGQVRAYKGLDELLDAFSVVRGRQPNARLVIAGNPGKDPASVELARRIEDAPDVVAELRVVPDDELQVFLNAADVVVLPYRQALNSGALQLALSFGRPVVAAHVGCLPSALDEGTGRTYDPDGDDLADVLLDAAGALGGPATERAAYDAARRYTYVDMARDFAALITDLTTPRGTDGDADPLPSVKEDAGMSASSFTLGEDPDPETQA